LRPFKGAWVRTILLTDHALEFAGKRLFVIEGEFANALKVMAREGNTLSRECLKSNVARCYCRRQSQTQRFSFLAV
jgi:hypothetical protein